MEVMRMSNRLAVLILPILAAVAHAADLPANYPQTANRLIDAALADRTSMDRLEYLCYQIGNRLSGSQGLERAIQWSAEEMRKAGLENVRTIPVKVPHWVRGRESARLVAPAEQPLYILGLGGSVATPKEGITADVVVVSSFDELEKLGRAAVQGKIVLYDAPFTSYGETVAYRGAGASRAAHLGAVAALVRSVTARSLRDPHTGAMRYSAGDPQIPTAAVSVEDAMWLHGLARAGQNVRVHLEMEARTDADADSFDVMGEIVGSEKPDEIIAIGGHIDSWDVGQGAHDDGASLMAALEAVSLMKKLGIRPRRTIRVVFWTNEENGGRGGVAYRDWLGDNVGKHVAAIEMDGGAETPVGFEVAASASPRRRARAGGAAAPPTVPADFQPKVAAIAKLLARIHSDKVVVGESEADVEPLLAAGVPVLGLRTTMEHYFDYHHTEADTFDKVNREDFRKCVATFAVMAWGLAEWK